MTGLRVAYGGAQARFAIEPDLTTLGKVIGGGLPVGAYGGRREIMQRIAPLGPVYQAGTLSGNPLAVAAGLATLRLIAAAGTYEKLEALGQRLEDMFVSAAKRNGVELCVQRVGSMLTPFFGSGPIRSWDDAARCDRKRFASFHAALMAGGVYWPPSQFEAGFVSLAHDERAFSTTERAIERAFGAV
jgi:glutamate-1-semialdehyde 2,1-aminomutase